ncbi:hypothetical protein BKH43_05945 [Helicobacter sp. 13S00401-1]|uniref:hypothetical protein n=1 Tax=Helicobacter sp. 13S00401-1 TaxID=1905758 RepID=UPI000BA5AF8B|nr:hypothetical protein [Helicobacter sp. 13S00401-1]PAF50149.1 hypothetical protein BKH43_05945 [Helicobacter sp. 13S00401-1]
MSNEDFEKKLNELGLNKKDFSRISGAAYQTITNWRQKEGIPAWVRPFLNYYEQAKEFQNMLSVMEKYRGYA